MKYINLFELCLTYQNHELLRDFIHCVNEIEERPQYFYDRIKSNESCDCEMSSVFC